MTYWSASHGSMDQTRLGVAIGVPLGVILLVGLTAFIMIRLRKRRRIPHFRALPVSQNVRQPPTPQEGIVVSPTPITGPTNSSTALTFPGLTSFATSPDQPQLRGSHYLDRENSPLSSLRVAPPPYRSPNPTSRY